MTEQETWASYNRKLWQQIAAGHTPAETLNPAQMEKFYGTRCDSPQEHRIEAATPGLPADVGQTRP